MDLDVSCMPISFERMMHLLNNMHRLRWRLPKFLFFVNRYIVPSLVGYATGWSIHDTLFSYIVDQQVQCLG